MEVRVGLASHNVTFVHVIEADICIWVCAPCWTTTVTEFELKIRSQKLEPLTALG